MLNRRVTITIAALVAAVLIPADMGHASPTPRYDGRAPTVTFTTRDGDVKLGLPTTPPVASDLTRVSGRVKDLRSGVRNVRVLFCAGGWKDASGAWGCGTRLAGASRIESVAAELTCGRLRRRCAWSAPVPVEPEQYLVLVRARDRAGNRRDAGPVLVTVL